MHSRLLRLQRLALKSALTFQSSKQSLQNVPRSVLLQHIDRTPVSWSSCRNHSTGPRKNVGNSKRSLSDNASAAQPSAAVDELDWMKNLRGGEIDEKLQGKRDDWWWTGIKPSDVRGEALGDNGEIHCLSQPALVGCTRAEVQAYFDNSWLLTEILFSSLQGEEAFMRPPYHSLRHPLIFYYGHVATFYTNKLRVAGLVKDPINPYFEDIFEVGVDEMRWDDISHLQKDWPCVSEVHAYRQEVYKLVTNCINEQFGGDENSKVNIPIDSPLWALMMAIEHEKIHLETSSVLFRELPLNLLRTPEGFVSVFQDEQAETKLKNPIAGKDYPQNALVEASGGRVTLGKERDYPTFGWDNEYGFRELEVPDFKASKFMVSNGEFYEFVSSGGYRSPDYWTKDGWEWRKYGNRKRPFFWEAQGPSGSHEYALRTIFEVVDMPWSAPAIVNYHEATAFVNWKKEQIGATGNEKYMRLLTEAEHHLLREKEHRNPEISVDSDPTITTGGRDFSKKHNLNMNLAFGSETPVDHHKPNQFGFHDVLGNAWEWAEDDFNPLDGFEVHPYYDDFSSPCFDGEHTMILGGSFISCGDSGANLHCRYHFRPHFLQHSGFRYVVPSVAEPLIKGQNIATHLGEKASLHVKQEFSKGQQTYESDILVNQYLALHYGQSEDNVDYTVRSHANRPDHALDFSRKSAELLFDVAEQAGSSLGDDARALDIGCAVGGASFALAKKYGSVVGLDYSEAFVHEAEKIRSSQDDFIEFSVPVEGGIVRERVPARVPPAEARARTNFMVGDACNLPSTEKLGGRFDAVLMANLLCRLPQPLDCLTGLNRIVKDNGVVLLLSPYSWLEEFTPKSNWLQSSKNSAECLKEVMQDQGFEQIISKDVPLIIREHERKYQYIISHAAGFAKRN